MKWWFLAAVLVPLWGGSAVAQSLGGTVRDPDGAPLPGAEIVVPALSRGVVADAEGRFLFPDLPQGVWRVEVRFLGFETYTAQVQVGPQGTPALAIVLVPTRAALGEVVVSASAGAARLTEGVQSMSTLTPRALARHRGQTLGKTLEMLPGVSTLTTGPSIAKPVVRGLHSERVVVVNAGVAQEGQQWGGEHGPEIDPFVPARIELVRGVAGVEYGVGAIGGVIRVRPRDLPERPGVGGEVQANAFSNNRQGAASLLVEGALRPGLGWRVQGSGRRAGDARAPRYGLANTGFAERSGLVAIGLHRPRFGADVQLSHFSTRLGLFQGAHIGNADDLRLAFARGEPVVQRAFSYSIAAPRQSVAHTLVSAQAHVNTRGGDRLEVQYGYQFNARREFDSHYRGQTLAQGRLAFSLDLATHTLELRARHRPWGRWTGSAGFSGTNAANRNGEAGQLVPNFRALTGGVFVREAYVGPRLTVEAGGRYDYRHVEAYPRVDGAFARTVTHYGAFTFATGALWHLAPAWSLAANVGTAWRPPSINELYANGVHHGTAQFERGDTGLGRERSLGVDATLRHEARRWQAEASAFQTSFDGFLMLFPDTAIVTTFRGAFPRYLHQQTRARLRGLDGQVAWRPLDALGVEATASLVRADDLERGTPLYGMPADRASLTLTAYAPRLLALREAEVSVTGRGVRRQSRVPEGVDFAPPPPGYALVGVGIGAQLRVGGVPAEVSLEVENLFDTAYRDFLSRYRYFADDPGRNVVLRLRVPFGYHTF